MTELEHLTIQEIYLTQRPHGMEPPYSLDELLALGAEDALKATRARAKKILNAIEDPYNHGYFFPAWDAATWELCRHRVDNPGVPNKFGVFGSNGAGKSQYIGRLFTLAFEQCNPDSPEHQNLFWTFSIDDDKSAEVIESVIYQWLPNDYKTETGRVKKMAKQKLGYDKAGGFTNNELAIPSGAVCRFRTWAQDIGKVEGGRPVTCWADEACPADFLEVQGHRLLTASETTLDHIPLWQDLLKAKAANPELPFPHEHIGKLLVGVAFLTYTFRDGFTETVRYYLQDAVTMREIEADPELLPRRDKERGIIGGEMLPQMIIGKDPTKRAVWLYAWQNPLGGNWAGMKKTLIDKSRAEILWKAYGIAEGTANSPLPNFNKQVHCRPLDWITGATGTWYHGTDPVASGGKTWFMLWGLVLAQAKGHMAAGDLFIAREYPQVGDPIEGLESNVWALAGGKDGKGIAGPAQKVLPKGYEFRRDEIRRIEKDLARLQGDPLWEDEQHMKDFITYGNRVMDQRPGNTQTAGVAESKSVIEWMADLGLDFLGHLSEPGGKENVNNLKPSLQTVNEFFMYNRELVEIDPATGWMVIDPLKGRGPKIWIADTCTNLIFSLTHYLGIKGPMDDPVDVLRMIIGVNPTHVDLTPRKQTGQSFGVTL